MRLRLAGHVIVADVDFHGEPDFDAMRRLVAGVEPVELQAYLAKVEGPLLQGSTVHPIGTVAVHDLGGLLVAGGHTHERFAGTYLTLGEYLDAGPFDETTRDNAALRSLLDEFPAEEYLVQLAILNHLQFNDEATATVERRFLRALRDDMRERVEAALSVKTGGLGKRFLHRQPILAAMRRVIRHHPPAEYKRRLPLDIAAIYLSHAAATMLDSRPSSDDERLGGLPTSLAMELLRNAYFHRGDDDWSVIDRFVRLWNVFGKRPLRNALSRSPAEVLLERTGLEVEDFLALGFALWAPAGVWERGRDITSPLDFAPRYDPTKVESFLREVSMDLDEFRATIEDDHDEPWNFLAFESRPVMRIGERLLVLDEDFMMQRVTKGLYWCLFDHLKGRPSGNDTHLRCSQAYGDMMELMVEDQLQTLVPMDLGGSQVLYTEEDLKAAYNTKACDAALYFGTHFALFEVVSSGLKVDSRVYGSAKSFREDTEKLVLEKVGQVATTAACILADEPRLTGHPPTPGLKILPVVVVGGGFPINHISGQYLAELLPSDPWSLDARYEPLCVIDLAELEHLEGLAERHGQSVVELLVGWKQSPYASSPLRNYLIVAVPKPLSEIRPTRMEAVEDVFKNILARLDLPEEESDTTPDQGGAGD